MATRAGVPGTKSGGTDSLSVADFNNLPGGCIAKVGKTGNQTSITTVTDISGLSITYTFPGGRLYSIHAHIGEIQVGADTTVILLLRDGGSGTICRMYEETINNVDFTSINASYFYTPSAGSSTLKLSIAATGGGSPILDVLCSSEPSAPGEAKFWIVDEGPSF